MKAILVLDEMPVNCCECLCLDTTDIINNGGDYAYCWALNKALKNVSKDEFIYVKKPKKCPLKPMPNEREEKDHYDFGWNDCVRVLNDDYNLCKLG